MSSFIVLLSKKEGRENKRYTKREIAKAIGVSESTVGRWMKGDLSNLRVKQVQNICEWLGCDIGDLLHLIPEEEVAS